MELLCNNMNYRQIHTFFECVIIIHFLKHAANHLNFEANVSGAILPLHKIIPTLLTSGYLSLNFGTIEAAKDAPPESSTTDFILSKIVLHP